MEDTIAWIGSNKLRISPRMLRKANDRFSHQDFLGRWIRPLTLGLCFRLVRWSILETNRRLATNALQMASFVLSFTALISHSSSWKDLQW